MSPIAAAESGPSAALVAAGREPTGGATAGRAAIALSSKSMLIRASSRRCAWGEPDASLEPRLSPAVASMAGVRGATSVGSLNDERLPNAKAASSFPSTGNSNVPAKPACMRSGAQRRVEESGTGCRAGQIESRTVEGGAHFARRLPLDMDSPACIYSGSRYSAGHIRRNGRKVPSSLPRRESMHVVVVSG